VHGGDVELEGRAAPRVPQQIEQGVAVLAAGDRDHDVVALGEQPKPAIVRVICFERARRSGEPRFM
jgi:hypothetical protein